MLRYNESMDERFRAYEQLGRDNLICISGIRRWCKNAEIKPTAWGLAAETTGLADWVSRTLVPARFWKSGSNECAVDRVRLPSGTLRGLSAPLPKRRCILGSKDN